ncbi:neurotrypsin-like isoform X2 [Amphiura filiformis]
MHSDQSLRHIPEPGNASTYSKLRNSRKIILYFVIVLAALALASMITIVCIYYYQESKVFFQDDGQSQEYSEEATDDDYSLDQISGSTNKARPHGLDFALPDCPVGEDIEQREYTLISEIVEVFPRHAIACAGVISRWRFMASSSATFQALIFRQESGDDLTRWTIVGINDIPATEVKPTEISTYTVPTDDQISVEPGYVLGVAIDDTDNPRLNLDFSGTPATRYFYTYEDTHLAVGNSYTMTFGPSRSVVSLSAEVVKSVQDEPTTEESKQSTIEATTTKSHEDYTTTAPTTTNDGDTSTTAEDESTTDEFKHTTPEVISTTEPHDDYTSSPETTTIMTSEEHFATTAEDEPTIEESKHSTSQFKTTNEPQNDYTTKAETTTNDNYTSTTAEAIVPDQIRLIGGSNSNEGRVEVYHNGVWGTICDDHWDANDARVICRQLGLPYSSAHALISGFYGQGSGPIWLDNVACSGSENSLTECRHSDWGKHNCAHVEDAGVACIDGYSSMHSVRLVYSGTKSDRGRVEVLHNGIWGTVCDDYWDHQDAKVVCRQLGLPHEDAYAIDRAHFGRGSGPIWLDNVDCSGSEDSLDECHHAGWGNGNCGHGEDAGVVCAEVDWDMDRIPDLLNTSICGTQSFAQRIVGGQNSDIGEWPWAGMLQDSSGSFKCGATLINNEWAITAAHCRIHAHDIVFGDITRTPSSPDRQQSLVTAFCHPDYDRSFKDNDICLLRLETPVSYTNHVRPICLAVTDQEQYVYPTGTCYAIGWGNLEEEGVTANTLQEVATSLIHSNVCDNEYRNIREDITDNMICATTGTNSGQCYGDSGGALNCNDGTGLWHLVGVTSWGYGCAIIGYSDVMARVSRYSEWIYIITTIFSKQ